MMFVIKRKLGKELFVLIGYWGRKGRNGIRVKLLCHEFVADGKVSNFLQD